MVTSVLSGEARLWKAFWLFYLLGASLVAIVLQVLQQISFDLIDLGIFVNPIQMVIFMTVVAHAYVAFAWFGVWRCARNTDLRVFGYLARSVVVANAAWVALRLA